MPPRIPFTSITVPRDFSTESTSTEFRNQWTQPGDAFSVLLLLGGEIVARALAQVAGHGVAPVTFSFGWVAYSLSALTSAVGENKLMPQAPDCQCIVMNGKTGIKMENSSWIIGRMVRDFDSWCHPDTKAKTNQVLDERWLEVRVKDNQAPRPIRGGLIVSVYRPSTQRAPGRPEADLVYWSGFVTMALQLGISAVPLGISGHWGILLITACGTLLALLTGLLPQWRLEKWACRIGARDAYVLTRGNGAQHAIVVLGNGHGMNLGDLAAGQNNLDTSANHWTRGSILALAITWILLLITAAGIKDDTWYLLAIGGLGILQNVFVAGWTRRPEHFGVPLDFVEVLGQTKVMRTLFEVEEKYPGLGRTMRSEFFPGSLRPEEEARWQELEQKIEVSDSNSQSLWEIPRPEPQPSGGVQKGKPGAST
ncbi:hypothetical protein ACHAQA_003713 [Verticillium albo-atrum]